MGAKSLLPRIVLLLIRRGIGSGSGSGSDSSGIQGFRAIVRSSGPVK